MRRENIGWLLGKAFSRLGRSTVVCSVPKVHSRLRALLPNLPRVFATLLDKSDVAHLNWSAANHLIHSHPLFDEFFQPLGQLGECVGEGVHVRRKISAWCPGKQLDPLPSDYENRMSQSTLVDHRIPAEILLRHEARQAFEVYKVRDLREFVSYFLQIL